MSVRRRSSHRRQGVTPGTTSGPTDADAVDGRPPGGGPAPRRRAATPPPGRDGRPRRGRRGRRGPRASGAPARRTAARPRPPRAPPRRRPPTGRASDVAGEQTGADVVAHHRAGGLDEHPPDARRGEQAGHRHREPRPAPRTTTRRSARARRAAAPRRAGPRRAGVRAARRRRPGAAPAADGLGQHPRRAAGCRRGRRPSRTSGGVRPVDDQGLGRVGAELQDVGRAVQGRVSQTRPVGRAEGGTGASTGAGSTPGSTQPGEGRPDPRLLSARRHGRIASRVEVRRSARRRRTVDAHREGSTVWSNIPASMSRAQERHWVEEMLQRLERADETGAARAAETGDADLGAAPTPWRAPTWTRSPPTAPGRGRRRCAGRSRCAPAGRRARPPTRRSASARSSARCRLGARLRAGARARPPARTAARPGVPGTSRPRTRAASARSATSRASPPAPGSRSPRPTVSPTTAPRD